MNIDARFLHTLFVVLNSVLCMLFFVLMDKYKEMMQRIDELQGTVADNELSERIFNRELAFQQDMAIQNARFEERETLSHHIHNAIGHTITSSILALESAELLHDVSPEESMKKVLQARGKISQSLESIRRIIRMLDPENENTKLSDLASSLRLCAEQFAANTTLNLRHNLNEISYEVIIPKRHSEFLCSALMELLSNTAKYARATHVTISLSFDNKHIKLTVSDNGTAFSMLSNHEKHIRLQSGYGLKKIEERVRKMGGEFSIQSEDGFTVWIAIPNTGDGGLDG